MATDVDLMTLRKVLDDLRSLATDPNRQLPLAIQLDGFLTEMEDLLLKKGQDYSGRFHTWWNFEAMGILVTGRLSEDTVDHGFLYLIGVKLARLCALLSSGQSPNFESVEDSWLDLANYIVLLVSYKRYLQQGDYRESRFDSPSQPSE